MGRIIAAQGAPEQGAVWSRSNRAGRTTRPRMSWNATPESERRASPQIAALLTWIVPGAGHLYLGRPMLALLGFLLIEGLYLVGLNLSHGMLLEYLEPDLRGPFAGALTPEVGNLGMRGTEQLPAIRLRSGEELHFVLLGGCAASPLLRTFVLRDAGDLESPACRAEFKFHHRCRLG